MDQPHLPPLLGEDRSFLDMLEGVSRLAPLDRPALVIGERGTGKELVAARLHYLSRRWDRPLVRVNCAALSESLLESELFGHEAGAFTGAQRRRRGRFEQADGGTLVLDEIGTASPRLQEKILRVVEYGEFERLGGDQTLTCDVRLVGATNADLPAMAARGAFRPDLLDRLSFDVVNIPPLRARPADILPLANHFAIGMTRALGRDLFPGFAPAAERALLAHPWPGNVRELKNVAERAVYRHADPERPVQAIVFDPFDVPWRSAAASADETAAKARAGESGMMGGPVDFQASLDAHAAALLRAALAATGGNQRAAAERLGLGYHQFRRALARAGRGGTGRAAP
ncbi:MAG TPA: phage shock protein operon transcriptional activator [Alphaproteobacteria bacterium]|nr:phage shock protein operon transcriptional activator [Alphaproteobacteria bacterium]